MSSFILHFRAWIAAFLILVAFETVIYVVGRPSPFDANNFLQFSFAHEETPQRLFVGEKLKAFAYSNPAIVQSGDSSGFYGIEPAAVMKQLPAGTTYLNMSCCANLGFNGYYNILKFMAEHDPPMKYMVLHFTPYTMPRPEMWDSDGAALWGTPELKVFGDAVYQEYISVWRIFHLPSLAYRRAVSDRIFYIGGLLNQLDRPLLNNVNYLEFERVFRKNLGWMPESDPRNPVSAAECDIPTPEFFSFRRMAYKSYLEEVLESFDNLAKQYNTKLVVVFQPVACVFGTGKGSEKARAVIEDFKRKHPDVDIPFPLIETWPANMFSVPAHVRHEYTDRLGDRLGQALAKILARNGDR
jgi:hypothetical protein